MLHLQQLPYILRHVHWQQSASQFHLCHLRQTDGTGTLCIPGQSCEPDDDARMATWVMNYQSGDVALRCKAVSSVLIEPTQANAMLALKTALGVTVTTWASTNLCRITEISTPVQNEWTGVYCNFAGSVESISVARQNLKGSFHSDISKLTALTYLYNWFDGSIPSTIASLPRLTTLGLFSNYLTGTMPIPSTSLASLDVGFNYLSGSFPKLSLAVCAADQNCFLSSSYCRSYGALQRPAAACAICGTTDGQGTLYLYNNFLTGSIPALGSNLKVLDFFTNYITDIATHSLNTCTGANNCLTVPSKCNYNGATQKSAASCAICGTTNGVAPLCFGGGGECVAAAASYVEAGALNRMFSPASPPMLCSSTSALLALKASLGVTFTSWAASVPCQVAGKQAATQTTWSGVLCGDTGDVLSISVARQSLTGSIDSDISKLTALTYLGLFSNYFTSTMPTLSTSLVALDVSFNFLSGSFPQLSLKSCAADQNCFLNSSYCRTYGALQRLSSACAICGTTNGQGTLCSGGMCFADSYLPVSQGIVNVPSLPPVALTCPGNAPLVLMNAGSVSTMLSIKSSLGLTSTTWDASLLCVAGFGNTPFGVTTWDRVLCSVGGSPLLLNFNILSLKVATLPADMSKLTGLTDLANFLTGSIPAMGTALKSLYIAYNYITNVATHSLTNCGGSMNCASNPSKCASDETTQRPAAECAICGTTNAVAPFCWGAGGECVVAAADNIAAGKQNIVYLPPAPPMVCSALLSLKASLGVTFTSWAASVPCQVVGKQAAGLPTWSGVLCGDTGDVIYM
ncbi:unnamed protein product [Closterium sp. Naga37s-1]|nr:unnamed protein product [Closterium sp. Naga37s-1]